MFNDDTKAYEFYYKKTDYLRYDYEDKLNDFKKTKNENDLAANQAKLDFSKIKQKVKEELNNKDTFVPLKKRISDARLSLKEIKEKISKHDKVSQELTSKGQDLSLKLEVVKKQLELISKKITKQKELNKVKISEIKSEDLNELATIKKDFDTKRIEKNPNLESDINKNNSVLQVSPEPVLVNNASNSNISLEANSGFMSESPQPQTHTKQQSENFKKIKNLFVEDNPNNKKLKFNYKTETGDNLAINLESGQQGELNVQIGTENHSQRLALNLKKQLIKTIFEKAKIKLAKINFYLNNE